VNYESLMRSWKQASSAVVLLSIAVYILVPTLDEVFIHSVLGVFLSQALNLSIINGTILSVIIYRSLGVVCLLGALLIGGKPIYQKLKAKTKKIKTVKTEKSNYNQNAQCGVNLRALMD